MENRDDIDEILKKRRMETKIIIPENEVNILLMNVGCDNKSECELGHCRTSLDKSDMYYENIRNNITSFFREFNNFCSANKIRCTVGVFQEVCNNKSTGIRDRI